MGYPNRNKGSNYGKSHVKRSFGGRSVAEVQNARSLKAKLVDAGLKAPLAESPEQWMANPNRLDLPEVDAPKEGPQLTKVSNSKPELKPEKSEILAIKATGPDGDSTVFKNFESNQEAEKIKRNLEAQPQTWAKVETILEKPKKSVEGSSATYNKATGWMAISFDSIPAPEIRQEMKSNGFRWNPVRKQWVAKWYPFREDLAKKYAGSVEQVDIKPNWAAKAEHAAEMAAKHEQESDRRYEERRKIMDNIPFGQPILVGHHSEKHHRSDLHKAEKHFEKSVEEHQIAKEYADKAERYGKKATGESPGLIYRRIQKLEADKRKMERQKAEAVEKHSQGSIEFADKWLDYYSSRLAVEQEKYKASGGIATDNVQFKHGDLVFTRHGVGKIAAIGKKLARIRLDSDVGIYVNRRNESLLSVDDIKNKLTPEQVEKYKQALKTRNQKSYIID
ncbi:MAG: DUF3560 domain-containing protein [Candidatus Nanoarchaeia archaeon]|nr:DUF3560 domain-containing protein [Candidatus Nanoarchaeia archaeon]